MMSSNVVSVQPKSSPVRGLLPPAYVTENSFFEKIAGNFKPRNDMDLKKEAAVTHNGDTEKELKKRPDLMASRRVLLAECSESLGIPGIPNFFKAPNMFLRLFWLLANVICWGGFAFVLYTLTIKFMSYPTVVTTDIIMGSNLLFPAVTLCNLNRVQSKRISRDSKFFGLTGLSKQISRDVRQTSNSKFDGFSFGVDAADCDSFGKDATEFLCSDKSNYLSENRVCDGKQDCDDGSDEDSSCPTGAPSVTTATDAPKWQYDKMEGIKNADLYKNVDWDKPDWYNVYANSKTDDYRDIYPFTYMNVTEVSEWSNQAADFLVSCSYDQNECDANLDFHPFMHERYGRCITFNSPELNRTRLLSDSLPSAPSGGRQRFGQSNSSSNSEILLETTARTGVLYGLKMNLWLDTSEYLPLISPSMGAILSIHDSLVEPDLDSSSVVVQPGTYTLLGVKRNQIKRLPHPYSDCAVEFPPNLPIPEEKKIYNYNQQICIKYCQQKLVYDSCGCYESFIVGEEVLCQHSDASVTECVFDVYANISAGQMYCDCPMACYDDFYETSLTSSTWPHPDYVPFIIDYIWKKAPSESPLMKWVDKLAEKANMDFDSVAALIQKEMVRISIHYETMSFQYIKFYGSYTIIQFIADIGGNIGLFVGVCAITVFEIIDWIFQLTCCTRVS